MTKFWLIFNTDDVRRSGRATKGQHTKNNDVTDTPTAAKPRGRGKGKAAKASSEPSPPAEDEGDAIIRCICGYVEEDEDDERKMVVCDSCEAWQHNECMEISENDDELPEQYFCEQCRPDLHKVLLEKVARGEKPWEERARQRAQEEEEERKARRRKGGKRGRKSSTRVGDIKADLPPEEGKSNGTLAEPQMETEAPKVAAEPEPKTENAQKRKLPLETPETRSPAQQVSIDGCLFKKNRCLKRSRNRKARCAKSPPQRKRSQLCQPRVASRALWPHRPRSYQLELLQSSVIPRP